MDLNFSPITPIDFIEADTGHIVPVSLFSTMDEDLTVYGRIKKQLERDRVEEDEEIDDPVAERSGDLTQ